MKLRKYQESAVNWIVDQCSKAMNPLFCCATGGGKTVTMSGAIKELAKYHRIKTGKNARFLSLVHRTEIHESNFATLKKIAPEIIATKIDANGKNFNGQIHFASVQTLQRIVEKLAANPKNRYNYIFVDECHHGVASTYIKIINNLLAENGRLIGVSATPNRGDNRPLDVLFDSAFVITTGDLIRQHWLCPPVCFDYSVKFENMKRLKKEEENLDNNKKPRKKRQFDIPEKLTLSQNFARALNNGYPEIAEKMIKDLIPDFIKGIKDRNKVIVFTPNHAFARMLFDLLKDTMTVVYLNDSISNDDRKITFARFENGSARILINVDIATEGYDCPSIDCVVDFDTNGSEGQWVQKVGRGLRLFPGKKDCLIIDFGSNLEKYPDLEQKCNLSGEIEKDASGGGFAFFKDDLVPERVDVSMKSESANGREIKMYHNGSIGLYFFTWDDYYVGVGNGYACVQDLNNTFHEFARLGDSLEYLGSVDSLDKLSGIENGRLQDVDVPINIIQISLLSPRYSVTNLRKNEARALIFWDSWKEEIINKIKKGE